MNIISKEITARNGADKIKIHGLEIGELAVKRSVLHSKRPGKLSTLLSFRDKEYGEWMPVWAWVIEHPEGIFLIDTGLCSDVHKPGYFKPIDFISKYYFETQMKFKIQREEELDHVLNNIGIDLYSISKVVLTHMHIDHVGGLKHIGAIPIIVKEKEWKTKDGSFPKLFPPNANIETVRLDQVHDLLGACHYLTKSKDLIMIPTPGHTRGHVSIALITNNEKILLFGGDLAYTEQRLLDKTFSATIKNKKENLESCNKIHELAKKHEVIFLPSHDSENGDRLKNDKKLVIRSNRI